MQREAQSFSSAERGMLPADVDVSVVDQSRHDLLGRMDRRWILNLAEPVTTMTSKSEIEAIQRQLTELDAQRQQLEARYREPLERLEIHGAPPTLSVDADQPVTG